jgi:hypothetical protein
VFREIHRYLSELDFHLPLDALTKLQVLREIQAHLQEKIGELQHGGVTLADAVKLAVKAMGEPRALARLVYEAQSRGTWTDVFLAVVPHLLASGLFLFHFWDHPLLAPLAFAVIIAITLLGWKHGRPRWLYSWIGYALFPLLVGGFALKTAAWSSLAGLFQGNLSATRFLEVGSLGAFYLGSSWLVVSTTVRVSRRDWVLASMMLLPLPLLGLWVFKLEGAGGLLVAAAATLHRWDGPMAAGLLSIGLASAVSVRLRRRAFKAGALLLSVILAGGFLTLALHHGTRLGSLLAVFLISLLILLSPALLQRSQVYEAPPEEALRRD